MSSYRNTMTVFFKGNEVPGFMIYALAGSEGLVEFQPGDDFYLGGEYTLRTEKTVVRIFTFLLDDPRFGEHKWKRNIRDIVNALLGAGACAVWLGCEGLPYVDPPSLFLPEHMSGGVLAWATPDQSSEVPSLSAPFQPISDKEQLTLRQLTINLSGSDGPWIPEGDHE